MLRDWRRINVAFTRARSKLVVFGSRRTLGRNEMLRGFVELMAGEGWVYALGRGAEEVHKGLGGEGSPSRRRGGGGGGGGRGSPVKVNGRESWVEKREFLDGRPVLRDLVNDFL